jgi:hypothetical protein
VAVSPPLVTGLASGGGWDYVRTWVTTLRETGYAGEIALVTVNCEDDLHAQCARWDVTTIEADPADLVTRHLADPYNGRHAVVARLIEERYPGHFVLACDTRDIVFQTDPFEFFGGRSRAKLYVVSEGVTFDQDDTQGGKWGAVKVGQLFSPRERAEMRGLESYNIGVLCGPAPLVSGIQKLVHLMCFNSAVKVTDQAALNVMMEIEPCRSSIERLGLMDGWAVHFASVRWGLVPEKIAPEIHDGVVQTPDGKVFSIVHQYDRSQQLRALVDERSEEPSR